MHFIDEAKIFVKSGNGGQGCMSFRREANIPRGGPDGGDGGRGGSVIARCIGGLNTLIDYRYAQHFKARVGEHGMGDNRSGSKGEDLILQLPVGTQIIDEDGVLIADMTEVGQEYILVKGGDGGLGNAHFKSSINQAPRRTTKGHPGEELWVWLKLKLISDAGLVGLPNAGKSTFLSVVSRAKPKIANYPFTTLKPMLGVVYIDDREFVMADIPGLIEGAHQGVGLGIRFLKHIERCRTIIHLIDINSEDVVADYNVVRGELENYGGDLGSKEELVVLNKIDSVDEEDILEKQKQLEEACGKKIYTCSGVTGKNVKEILRAILNIINPEEEPEW